MQTISPESSPDASQDFAQHMAGAKFENLPAAAIAATKRSIFDTVGVMLAGSGPHGNAWRIVGVLQQMGSGDSTVVGHSVRLPPVHAAFANASMAHQFDFDDTHDAAVAHPTANTLSAGLAVAESLPNCSGKDLIASISYANDIVCRLGLALTGNMYEYPWVRPPVLGIWGATAVAASLLKLAPQQIQSAFGFTLHQTAGSLECLYSPGSEVRGMRDGFSARNGVTAAYLAQAGMRAERTALEGRFGFFQAYHRGDYKREVLLSELGSRFEGQHVSIKPWPSARECHATLQAILDLRESGKFTPADVAKVTLWVGETNIEFCEPAAARRSPPGRMDALSSLPFAVAVALKFGSVPLMAYSEDGLRDPETLSLTQRVHWKVDTSRSHDGTIEGATVEIELRGGQVLRHTVRHGAGHPDHPLSEQIVIRKFHDCAQMAHRPIPDGAAGKFWEVVDKLERISAREFAAAISSLTGGAPQA